jgi:hypothetical protein
MSNARTRRRSRSVCTADRNFSRTASTSAIARSATVGELASDVIIVMFPNPKIRSISG